MGAGRVCGICPLNSHFRLHFSNMAVTLIFSINLKIYQIMQTLEWLGGFLFLGPVSGIEPFLGVSCGFGFLSGAGSVCLDSLSSF